mgnify:CR=1 FL=1
MNKKPVIIQSDISPRRKITIIVENGNVENIVKERCSEIDVEVNDYDVEDLKAPNVYKDEKGKEYLKIKFN